jgi:hypothetical protein
VTFHWVALRGPGVSVTPEDARGMTATASLPWIDPYVAPETGLRCNRADIAVFAVRRGVPSAPAFLSVSFPANRTGQWRPDGQPTVIDYRVAADDGYVDPALHPDRDWRDTYRYDADGRLLGWRRERQGTTQDFTRHGLRVLEVDKAGRPLRAEQIAYPVVPRQGRAARVTEERLGRYRTYGYMDEHDQLGTLRSAG